jgi:putative ABC transport system ATP-binding protein
MPNVDKKIIVLKNVSKTFPLGENKISALEGINLEIDSGSFVLIYGPSGCGKTTLLNIIAGLDLPTLGGVNFLGADFCHLQEEERDLFRAEHIGMVHQVGYWIKSLTVLENVILPLMMRGLEEERAKSYGLKTLSELGIAKLAGQLPGMLSGGQQQKAEVARALVAKPPLILADEPTGDLDSKSGDEIMDILSYLNQKHKQTILLVTHNLNYWDKGNRRIEMKDGRIVKDNRGIASD